MTSSGSTSWQCPLRFRTSAALALATTFAATDDRPNTRSMRMLSTLAVCLVGAARPLSAVWLEALTLALAALAALLAAACGLIRLVHRAFS